MYFTREFFDFEGKHGDKLREYTVSIIKYLMFSFGVERDA